MNTNNFEQLIDRKYTNSIKWDLYPEDVLPLWVADMDFEAPQPIVAALQQRIDHHVFGYEGPDEELLKAICDWVGRRHHWTVTPDQIMLMTGVVSGMNWVTNAFKKEGKKLLIQPPVYPPFFQVAKNTDTDLVEAPLICAEDGYQIDFDEFEKQAAAGVGVFILCNPHNPVGRVYTRAELERMGEICLRYGITICADEIHCDLVYPGHEHISIASLSDDLAANTITLMAASKTFNIPGLNFSFAVISNEESRKQMKKAASGMTGHAEILANAAAKAAFTECDAWLEKLLVYLEGNRDYLLDFIRAELPEIKCFQPQGTYLAWLDCRSLKLEPDAYHFFLEKAKVALNDGKTFGKQGNNFVRLNFGCPRATLQEALERMAAALH
ncbi:MalY/PatB family protein [Pelolinea submarina]|uniref:cysteine-S-conjugate beta-lyase n=1 Tax=Pelolinea submarina TaxID=913107 RepID=A0A3E0AHV5_9CHLR|nr:PatB family C-S lyase [Pelolinea submarina]REG11263.1 cystathionine beta-lyase [Pelolinea submarina]